MFFDRFDSQFDSAATDIAHPQASPQPPVSTRSSDSHQPNHRASKTRAEGEHRLRRRLVALGLAVNLALPITSVSRFSTARAADRSDSSSDATTSDATTPVPGSEVAQANGGSAGSNTGTNGGNTANGQTGASPAQWPYSAAPTTAPSTGARPAPRPNNTSSTMVTQTPAPTHVTATRPPPPAPPMPAQNDNSQSATAERALADAANYQRIRQQQQQFEAQQLVERARSEQAANEKTQALNDYTRAADLDPQNEQAVAGRNEMADELGVGNAPSGLGRVATEVPERIQAITYSFNSAIHDANVAIGNNDFAAAQRAIDRARIAANTDPTIFSQQQINVFQTTIANTQASLERVRQQHAEAEANRGALEAERQQALAAQQAQQDRERTVAGLIQDARVYIDQGKYREALAVIDHIQALDPTNQYASSVRLLIEDKAAIQEQRGYQEEFDRQLTAQLNRGIEDMIPYDDILRYPSDWPQISEMRDAEVAAERGESDEDAAIQAILDRHLNEVRFNANSLSDVIDYLRDVTGANIFVDWPALERANISRDAPVTARLRDIKFSKALELIFRSVEGDDPDHQLGYTIDEGVITISTQKELNKNTLTRRYDINDLLFVPPDYTNAPSLDITNNNSSAGGGGGGGASGSNPLSSAQLTTADESNQREQRIDEIKKYIIDNVAPATWKDNGGDVGNITSSPLRPVLLITQTRDNLEQIDKVLDSLRASQALQVSIETRFLTVQRNYLEDIGVNTSFEFNPNSYWSSKFSPITLTNGQATTSATAIGGGTGTSSTATPTGSTNSTTGVSSTSGVTQSGSASGLDWTSRVANAGVPGSIAASTADYPTQTVVAGSYVDNMTVSFLIRAVEANQNVTALTAPRLTLFSGQRAVIIIETEEAYVSGLTAVTGTGAALFQPTVSTVPAVAVVMSVLATVSPDRKYVYLDIRPQLASLVALANLSESAVVTNTGITGVATNQIITGTLQLPEEQFDVVETSCSVPDGATLLLGGQTLAGETEREQGVPVLSKIPFLKRLFTNRAQSQDEQILLILVKPTILIQHEQEQKQFPLLSSKVTQ